MTVSSKGKVPGADLVVERECREDGGHHAPVVLIDCGVCAYNVDNGCRLSPPMATFLPHEQAVVGPGAPPVQMIPVSVFPPVRPGMVGCSKGVKHKLMAAAPDLPELSPEAAEKLKMFPMHQKAQGSDN